MAIKSAKRSSGLLLGSLYVLACVAAAPLAYAGALWIGVSDRGWETQVAAGALLVGWLALAVGALAIWTFVRAGERSMRHLGVAAGVVAVAAYAIAFSWGGRMLI